MKIIVISGKAGHGKDTLAGFMKEELESKGMNVLITHYGDLLKYICKTFFNWNGKKDEEGRTLLQYVGTEEIRSKDPDYWVNFIRDILLYFPNRWDYVMIPDTRFPNEIEGLKPFCPIHLHIVRPGYSILTEEQQKHASETALDGYFDMRMEVMNDGTLEDLRMKANEICKRLDS